jgi:DNA primase
MYDVQSIRQAHPIAEVISSSGVELRRLGRRLKGLCPFHADAEPSLVVYPKDANYFCFGCGAGGDVIDFVERVNGIGFREAASLLLGPHPPVRPVQVRERGEAGFRSTGSTCAESRVIAAAADFYHEALWCSPAALAYLALRGIERRTARDCRMGFAAPGLAQHVRRRGLSCEAAGSLGLLSGKRETMLGRIVVPDLNDGRATWMTGRILGGATPRYMNVRLRTPLLGLDQVDGDEAVVAEGVFDWLTLVQWGLPAVALLGTRISRRVTGALTPFRRVYIALDSDEAGQRASAELAAALGERAAVIQLPLGAHDLNDLGRLADGRRAFERCLELATEGKEDQWQRTDEPAARRAA